MTRSPRRLLFRLFGLTQLVALTLAAFTIAEPASRATSTPTATSPIQHVVIVLKENRSFDEYFGAFPGLGSYGTTTAKNSKGETVDLTQNPTPDPTANDIDHSPFAFNLSCHLNSSLNPPTCRNDQFDLEKGAKESDGTPLALSQMPANRIPDYWAWASKYALGAQFYASWKGASFGNNLFEVAGQSGAYDTGYTGNTCIPNVGMPDTQACHTDGRSVWALPIRSGGGKLSSWGCDDPADTSVKMSLPPAPGKGFLKGVKSNMYPCYLFKSLPDVLTQNGLTWGFYVDSDSRARRHNGLTAINSIRNDPSQWSNVKTTADFITAAQNGNLPNVSWVLGKQTEHPPLTACAGENQSVSYINAVMNGSDWDSTAIFVVWDEWGGFYDHMPPPQQDFVQYGFRVPFLAISPYTKAGSSSDGGSINTTLDSHASMLAFVLDNWGLPANSLTPAVANANDLMDMFDFQRTPNGKLLGNPARSCTPLTLAEKRLYHRNPWD